MHSTSHLSTLSSSICEACNSLIMGPEKDDEIIFQFHVECEEGINLYVDLNSTPTDWMQQCMRGLPQNPHCDTYLSKVSDGIEQNGRNNDLSMQEASVSQSPCISSSHKAADGQDQFGNPVSRFPAERVPMPAASNHACQGETEREDEHRSCDTVQLEAQPPDLHKENSQNRSASLRHTDGSKKSPSVKNLRVLKTLARGPMILQQPDPIKRRRSSRLVDKDISSGNAGFS
eukprot:TRINITY_DN5280_c0_g1_i2.p1 TRINITY_DN5280_c0_g1~~TRINITY_DN5280_c0_g1_i2.p1  ORF type:complete len:231 (+),score=49.87 TRINITY_DN5280_c0_g1_i2:213-905(+)